ncbi:HAD family hydrolase [Kitasatospora viridis]|uniref:HAD family hydrolase n=1 Tax=Kitasatospora viridis TaxID=281105 RepID=UPI001FECE57D|nr:HAD-IA family hydrolase [Kitasatospora viridis]
MTHVLLDFDGPVCGVFSGLPAPEVARRLRRVLPDDGQCQAIGATETDPLSLLRSIAHFWPDLAGDADAALTALEVEAVQSGRPNPEGESVLRSCAVTGRRVSIVSNNSGAAIARYLADHGLSDLVAGVFGRPPGDLSSMKPSPRLLLGAMEAAGTDPEHCIFVGDAVRDVEAGHSAGVRTIGYANKPGKDARLAAAGAVVVVDSMALISDALT